MSKDRIEVVVTGGGTSGHVLPAIAVGEALVDRGHPPSAIRFVGTRRGVERHLVPEAGFVVTLLPGRGFVRRASLRNIPSAIGLGTAFVLAAALLSRWRPRVVVSVGGFASVACSLAAAALRIPVVVVNVDAVPGAANRLVGRFARASAVAFASTRLPRAVVTGAPVRAAVLAVDRSERGRAEARTQLGIAPRKKLLAIVGGSLGARRLNELALTLAARFAERDDLVEYHVSGERDHQMSAERATSLGLSGAALEYRLVAYESRLPLLFAAADLVICRAGASTVAEVCIIGTPSILVPLPGAPSDHQAKNAEYLERAGAAVVIADEEATVERVWDLVSELLDDSQRRRELSKNALDLGRPDAAHKVAGLVEESAASSTPRGRARSKKN